MINYLIVSAAPAALFGGLILVFIYRGIGVTNLSLIGQIFTILMWILVLPVMLAVEIIVAALSLILTGRVEFVMLPLVKRSVQDLFDMSKTIKITVERQ